eukprot:scaffold7052_cov254-Pinguiococcus_pyrenoidosus.AAC.37
MQAGPVKILDAREVAPDILHSLGVLWRQNDVLDLRTWFLVREDDDLVFRAFMSGRMEELFYEVSDADPGIRLLGCLDVSAEEDGLQGFRFLVESLAPVLRLAGEQVLQLLQLLGNQKEADDDHNADDDSSLRRHWNDIAESHGRRRHDEEVHGIQKVRNVIARVLVAVKPPQASQFAVNVLSRVAAVVSIAVALALLLLQALHRHSNRDIRGYGDVLLILGDLENPKDAQKSQEAEESNEAEELELIGGRGVVVAVVSRLPDSDHIHREEGQEIQPGHDRLEVIEYGGRSHQLKCKVRGEHDQEGVLPSGFALENMANIFKMRQAKVRCEAPEISLLNCSHTYVKDHGQDRQDDCREGERERQRQADRASCPAVSGRSDAEESNEANSPSNGRKP